MRIALISWSRRKVGGAEAYLESVIPELVRTGHTVSFWHESEGPLDRSPIPLPDGVPAAGLTEHSLSNLATWRPEVLWAHSLARPVLEARVLDIAPAVFLAHAYYGTCVSGSKMFSFPHSVPCSRRFGLGCLVRYYPRRCGGLSPFTMVREYRRQAGRLSNLRRYRAILTLSRHMRDEYLRHGFDPDRTHALPYPGKEGQESGVRSQESENSREEAVPSALYPLSSVPLSSWRLLFLGRMDRLKGGRLLLDALPTAAAALDRPLHVTFTGDGPDRADWEQRAARVSGPRVSVRFTGWLGGDVADQLLAGQDLLVVPSVWPEPFGAVGVEAGRHGVPAVAFAVGGIRDWLTDGINGHLAPGDPPTPAGLATAIVRCLRDPAHHAGLRDGTRAAAGRFDMARHLASLLPILECARKERA
jgi:glycosyltransferase involved in cell wall biosynthesis